MDVFQLRRRLVEDYRDYTRSFIKLKDPRIDELVMSALNEGEFWPDPLLQINPTFESGGHLEDLVADGTLHSGCAQIFRARKTTADPHGSPLILHAHQREAIAKAKEGKSYILTSGTGSGKSLTYIVPIVDHILRNGSGRGVQAIIVYPMNALANSQTEALKEFLNVGISPSDPKVTFARYTGQEQDDARERLRRSPPDILLTNYMMLELMLTRAEDRTLVRAAEGLRFLVFDELHTYRGRQGADVAMLIRRCRQAFQAT
ncbi:MAG TPA: DEAD/DEAH box helicase, partial [Planctomycetota bacterium]|nr:DEAD/DEAH box helicase [Planctomycetota bacterium]